MDHGVDQTILQYLAHLLLFFQMFLPLIVVNKCELFTAIVESMAVFVVVYSPN